MLIFKVLKKQVYLLFFLFCAYGHLAQGQINHLLEGIVTNDQYLIKTAVKDAFYIVRQDYILRDTIRLNPNEYGRAGMPYFGRNYHLGILSNNKIWLSRFTQQPWEMDTHYDKYKADKSIIPFLVPPVIKPLGTSDFTAISTANRSSIFDSLIVTPPIYTLIYTDTFPQIEQQINQLKQENGWLVLAYTEDIPSDSTEVRFAIYRTKVDFSQAADASIKAPSITKNVLGGMYISTKIELGKIQLFFAGILNETKTGWSITPIPSPQKAEPEKAILSLLTSEDNYITVQLLDKNNQPIVQECMLTTEKNSQPICTNDKGIASIKVHNKEEVFIKVNGMGAACATGGNRVEIICLKRKGQLEPKRKISKCKPK